MPQIFPKGATTAFRLVLLSFPFGLVGLICLGEAYRMSWITEQNVAREQPIQFSHKHHVGDDGIDCRYCHTSVETSGFAGIPPTETCLNCHRQVWLNSPMMAPLYRSVNSTEPILWTRVHDLPDYVYFEHSIHVHKGIGCSTCHGRVDEMALTRVVAPLIMNWCLDCHRHPEKDLRPLDKIYDMEWQRDPDQDAVGRRLAQEYHIQDTRLLTSCSTCHR